MQNKDKDIQQKVAEYMEILGIHVPAENEGQEGRADPETAENTTAD